MPFACLSDLSNCYITRKPKQQYFFIHVWSFGYVQLQKRNLCAFTRKKNREKKIKYKDLALSNNRGKTEVESELKTRNPFLLGQSRRGIRGTSEICFSHKHQKIFRPFLFFILKSVFICPSPFFVFDSAFRSNKNRLCELCFYSQG